jgi:indole-3-glycerol phosphate synthase
MRSPGDFLARVLGEKRDEIAGKKRRLSAGELERRIPAEPPRDFRAALARRGAIIAEIKRRSPSVPVFRQNGPVEDLARVYAENGAAAISIVTDERHFGTSLADVARVQAAVGLPVLVKDFVFDDYQVLEARAAGADALLLIARILAPEELAHLLARARRLGMESLVECHDATDLARAVGAGASCIGVNHRDLASLAVSLSQARDLFAQIPTGLRRVAESGIASRGAIESLLAAGAEAFLVGGALLQADDPGAKLRELSGATHE